MTIPSLKGGGSPPDHRSGSHILIPATLPINHQVPRPGTLLQQVLGLQLRPPRIEGTAMAACQCYLHVWDADGMPGDAGSPGFLKLIATLLA